MIGRFALSCTVLCAVLGAQTTPGARPVDVAFERVLYLHGGPERDDAFWARLRELGFSAATASIGEDPATPGRHGLRLFCDQLAGKGVLELRPAQFDPLLAAYEKQRDARLLARPSCLADPDVVARLVESVEASLGEALPFEPVGASLADEPSTTRHVNPLDLCASEAFVAAFREFLLERYGDIAKLNAVWNVAYSSFDEVEPWTADRVRARELHATDLPRNLAPWNDQLAFTDRCFAEAVRAANARVRAMDRDLPCGLTGMQPPSAYGGYDYRRLMPGASLFEVYPIGGARELAGALADPDALQLATLFPPAAQDPASMVDARVATLLAHGFGGVIVWSAGEVFDESGAVSRFGADVAHAFDRLAPVAERFGGARLSRSDVLLVESQASVRAHWMIDSSRDGDTWLRRLSSHEAENSTSMAARLSWVRLLEDLGLQPGFVPAEEVASRLSAEPPKLLVLPAVLSLPDDAVLAIRAFVDQGGHVVADHGTAIYDARLRRGEAGALDDLFGVEGRTFAWHDQLVLEGRADPRVRVPGSGLGVAERHVTGTVGEAVDGGSSRVQIEARAGRGRATYLNIAVCEYAGQRLDPEQVAPARDLRARVRRVVEEAGVLPPVLAVADGLPTCVERLVLESADGTRLLAVRVNALDSPPLMRELGARGARPVELVFPREVRLLDVATGTDLGTGDRFDIELDPWVGAFFEVGEPGR